MTITRLYDIPGQFKTLYMTIEWEEWPSKANITLIFYMKIFRKMFYEIKKLFLRRNSSWVTIFNFLPQKNFVIAFGPQSKCFNTNRYDSNLCLPASQQSYFLKGGGNKLSLKCQKITFTESQFTPRAIICLLPASSSLPLMTNPHSNRFAICLIWTTNNC